MAFLNYLNLILMENKLEHKNRLKLKETLISREIMVYSSIGIFWGHVKR